MKHGRKRRLAKFFSLPVLALCGFLIAATLAGVGLATETTTDSSSTISTTTTPPPPPPPPPTTTTTTTTTPTGNEGCTPGFWKNNADKKGASQWTDPYDPTDLVSSVFADAPPEIGSLTLLAGLQLGGGGANALTRHAIAAVLSAAHPDIDYPLTVDEIVDMVNAAYASGDADTIESLKDTLDAFNNLGCTISQNA